MGSSQQFSLRWNNYLKHITSAFETLRTDEDLVDVTLSCEGKRIRAHKMLLSACSTYFRDLFKENPCQHPVIIFRNVKFDDLAALVDFIYQGEVNVVQEQLDSFMTTAELLAVQGLTDGTRKDDNIVDEDIEIPNEPEVQLRNVSGKVITNHKNNRSPILHSPFHAVDLQHETPPVKRRRYRESANVNFVDKSHRNALSPKESDSIKQDCQAMSDPVEIIPIMPNMKLEMPEYVEQDGSSCSYEEQNASENSNKLNLDESHIDTGDHENKPDISQTFYTNQATKLLEPADQSADIGYLISKPGTSGERMTQETTQVVIEQPSHSCKLCGKSFWNRDSMYKHMNMHKGTTQCPVCHKVLSRTTHMKRHLKNRHGWMGIGSGTPIPPIAPTLASTTSPSTLTSTSVSNPIANHNRTNANNDPYTTIRIRESSVERITSSPIP